MKIVTSYSVRLKQVSACFKDTLALYREAVNWFISVMDAEWSAFADCANDQMAVRVCEKLCIRTARNSCPKYSFSELFFKFPSYLRRAAIAAAFGLVSSYQSSLARWNDHPISERKKRPSLPKAGFVYNRQNESRRKTKPNATKSSPPPTKRNVPNFLHTSIQ